MKKKLVDLLDFLSESIQISEEDLGQIFYHEGNREKDFNPFCPSCLAKITCKQSIAERYARHGWDYRTRPLRGIP